MEKSKNKPGRKKEQLVKPDPGKSEMKTDHPLSEKDELKQAEDELRIRIEKEKKNRS